MTIADNIRIPRFLAAAMGFLLPFNLHLIPWSSQSPRMTDLIGGGFLVVVVVLLLMGVRLSRRLGGRVFVVALLLVPMFWHGLLIGELRAIVDAIRWVLGFGWALGLTWIARDQHLRPNAFKGFILGTIGCVGVVVMQVFGLTGLTMDLGLAARDADVGDYFWSFLRVPGMEPNVNGSAAVFSLCVPVALGLVDENRASRVWILVAIATVVTGSALTFNRSSILVSGVTMTAWVFLAGQQSVGKGWKIATVLLVVGGLATYGPPGGWERWQSLANLSQSSNFQVRVETTLASLDIALHNPLGLGKVYQTYIQSRVPGQDSAHNALLQLALMAGFPLVLWVIWKLGLRAVSLLQRGRIETWLSLHLLGLFFFEEYFAVPTIIALVAWLSIQTFTKQFFSNTSFLRKATASVG